MDFHPLSSILSRTQEVNCTEIYLKLAKPSIQIAVQSTHPLSSKFIHFHPLSSNFIHFHPLSSTFIHFHPRSSTFIHFQPKLASRGYALECFRSPSNGFERSNLSGWMGWTSEHYSARRSALRC